MNFGFQIPYGVADFRRIRAEGFYYVDKTGFIPLLEQAGSFLFFVRPRRFGFNIASNISLDAAFNALLGFSEEEVLRLYSDFKGVGRYLDGEPADWLRSFKPWYDGYCFAEEKIGVESVYNSDMVLYHLKSLVVGGRPPKNMVDANIATDYDKLQTIADIQHRQFRERHGGDGAGDTGEDVLPVTEQLAARGSLASDFADTTPVRGGIQGEIRIQGYMQAEFGHLNFYLARPEMELARGFCDFALFPERFHYGDVQHSYLVELKFSAKDAPESEIDAKRAEAVAQLARYRADPTVPALARGTTLHQIVFQFKGTDLVRLEQIAEEEEGALQPISAKIRS